MAAQLPLSPDLDDAQKEMVCLLNTANRIRERKGESTMSIESMLGVSTYGLQAVKDQLNIEKAAKGLDWVRFDMCRYPWYTRRTLWALGGVAAVIAAWKLLK